MDGRKLFNKENIMDINSVNEKLDNGQKKRIMNGQIEEEWWNEEMWTGSVKMMDNDDERQSEI